MVQEVMVLIEQIWVELEDLLLMFIYAKVLGMLGAFYSSHRIPITILLYESGSILLIAIALWVISNLQDRD